MRIVVGGSFHEPGLSKVVETAKKLKYAGHDIIFPSAELIPLNPDDEYVRFEGEEKSNPIELEKRFLSNLDKADAFVIAVCDGYIGRAAVTELYYSACLALNGSRR